MGEPVSRRRRQEPLGALTPDSGRVVRVLPDVPAIDREFDYLVDADADVGVGDVVRVDLGSRRVRGWITMLDPPPIEGVTPRPVRRLGGRGPSDELISLAGWAARRYAGRRAQFLRTATPPRQVHRPSWDPTPLRRTGPAGVTVRRVAPGLPRIEAVLAALGDGATLVVVPESADADLLVRRLRRDRHRVVRWPEQWADAVLGADVVVGTRATAWARIDDLGAIVVIDEHDESLRSESRPNWNARDVLVERGRRLDVPVTLVSPAPSLEALELASPEPVDRADERAGWATLEIVDRRNDSPGPGSLFSERLVGIVRSEADVVCVLNRTGRSQLLRCRTCDTTVTCERCDAAVEQPDEDLFCRKCGAARPVVCLFCGATRLVRLRPGVARVAEELAVLAQRPVTEITGGTDVVEGAAPGLVVGTEAALHRIRRCDVVVLLDADQELLAPRFRAREQALWLLARASRVVGGRRRNGRVVVQTRQPEHPVLLAARSADPAMLSEIERAQRRVLDLPPFTALARITGPQTIEVIDRVIGLDGVSAIGPDADGAVLLRAPHHDRLSEVIVGLADLDIKVELDPIRV